MQNRIGCLQLSKFNAKLHIVTACIDIFNGGLVMYRVLAIIASVFLITGCAAKGETAKKLYTFDLTYTFKLDGSDPNQLRQKWDDVHFVSSMQGIVNRKEPKLYIFYVGGEKPQTIDHHWLEIIRKDGAYLAEHELVSLPDFDALVKQFKRSIKGLVVYDENVPSTSNVASTVAGAENLACVRYDLNKDSLYYKLVLDPDGPKFKVKKWLINKDGSSMFTGKGIIPETKTPSTGSAKCDAYIWAKEKYLDTGKSNPLKMGYYLDAWWLKTPGGYMPNNTLSNHDYFIANKAFFFDLNPWDDETPIDDRSQPIGTDYKTLTAILKSAYDIRNGKGFTHIGGFVPWAYKYTNYGNAGGTHGGVSGEWRYAEILSCFNAFMDADALGLSAMANASVYQHCPVDTPYSPHPKPTIDSLKSKGYITADGKVSPKTYVTIYAGDYDSAAWLYQNLPKLWDDKERGSIPLGWGFNPNHAMRFPVGLKYVMDTRTPNDVIISGDSGAGYVMPSHLIPPRKDSGLPSGLDEWVKHNEKFYKDWGITITGFIIEGDVTVTPPEVMYAYSKFSPDGVIIQQVREPGMFRDMPFVSMSWYLPPLEESIKLMPGAVSGGAKPSFHAFRTVLWSATNHKKLMDGVKASPEGKNIEFVDPYTLMLLIKQNNNK